MPQFQMNWSHAPEFRALDEFTQGYIEALFFTNCEPGTTAENHEPDTQSALHGDIGFDNFGPGVIAAIARDCAEFQQANSALLEDAYTRDYDHAQAGRDYWFTRCGHGVGYWSREALALALEADCLGDALSDQARKRGNIEPYLGDDGRVYL